MKPELILNYLSALEKNNNREWYHSHKQDYLSAHAEFLALLQELILRLGAIDSSILHQNPQALTFKLVRDTRFSHDKSPYTPTFRAHIAAKGKLPIPVGYYLSIKPGDRSFLGGGLFTDLFKDATAMVRDGIAANPIVWESILSSPEMKELFSVQGSKLKNVPRGYDKNSPQAEYLKHKSWFLEYPLSDKLIQDPERFLDRAVDVFERMIPFNTFLNQALEGFTMPKR